MQENEGEIMSRKGRNEPNTAEKSFLTLSKKECEQAYLHLIENSDKKWEGSIALAKIGDYGGATSYAIISVEELVKAILLSFDGNGFAFRSVPGMKTLFKHHSVRYVIAFAVSVIHIVSEDLFTIVKAFRENGEGAERLMRDISNKDPLLMQSMKRYTIRKLIEIRDEFNWFAKMDIYRQEGFYVDYKEQIKSPIQISKENYEELTTRLEKVRSLAKVLIESLWSEESLYRQHFNLVHKNLVEKDGYKKIGAALAVLNQTRDNPFEVISRKLGNKSLSH